jgi:nicotinate-nucleotide adenylyltransferase
MHGTCLKPSSGLRIGLLGGSFNPAHDGHRAISLEALNRLRLHQVWWLVSPQNPLKDPNQNTPYAERLATASAVEAHPRIEVSDLEQRWGCRYTIETVCHMRERFPAHRFVWLMGADNFAQLHHWEDWTGIMQQMPIAVFNRPEYLLAARASRAAERFARARVRARSAALLPALAAPAWSLIEIPLNPLSSTALRGLKTGDLSQ